MLRVYFDSNALFDVLGRHAGIAKRVAAAVEEERVQIVVSDTNLIEFFGGADRSEFRAQAAQLLKFAPQWTVLATLPGRELKSEYAKLANRNSSVPVQVFNRWEDFLPLIADEAERRTFPLGIAEPTADAFAALYAAGSIRNGLVNWQSILAKHQGQIAEEMVYVGTRRNIFWKTIAHSCHLNFADSAELVDALWKNPDLAPAFRLDFELTLLDLDKARPRWTTNNFLDYVHARVLPYVDLFVTRDDALLRKLQWFDSNVRAPAAVPAFMSKVVNEWPQVEIRLT